MTTLNISQKNVSDGKNTFFKNNKMLIGTEAPTSGTYTRGDVVVNMGSDNDKNNMWILFSKTNWCIVNYSWICYLLFCILLGIYRK